MANLENHTALVTGASSGIGAAMARSLAAAGADVIISARRLDRLEHLATELHERYKVDVHCIKKDLSKPGAAAELYAATTEHSPIDILVNNAGFGVFDYFAHTDWQRNERMLALNVNAMSELTHHFLGDAIGRPRKAYVLNVSSVGAYQPVPYMASYCGTKAYIRVFSESLAEELRDTNVVVSCVTPGAVDTEFAEVSGQHLHKIANFTVMSPDAVARRALHAMLRGRPNVITGAVNKLNCFLLRFVPRRTGAVAASLLLGRPGER